MAISIGRKGFLGVALETTPGTAASPVNVKYLPYTTCTLHNVVEVLDDEAAKGIRERAWGSVAARTRGEGDIEIIADVENAPYLLIPALGSATSAVSDSETAAWEHTIRRKQGNPPQTLTLNFNNTVETRQFTYGTVNTCEISFSDGFVMISAGILSKAPAVGSGTKAITEERVLAFKDASIQFGTDLADAAGNDPTPLSAFTLTINNNAEAHYLSGSSSPDHIALGQLEVGGNYTLFFEDTTERAAHELQTPRAMIVTFTGATIGSETEEIEIRIPKFHITDRGVDTAPAGFVTENPTFVCDYEKGSYSVQVKITNEFKDSYPKVS